MDGTPAHPARVDWVDYAKGLCIVFVVMMHSTLGLESAAGREGWLHALVEFARPFRMPDFFLISGLFLANVIGRDWRTYLDRKVVHFAYFYLLWVTIQFAIKAPAIAASGGAAKLAHVYLAALVDPFGTLWFIYLLPIFFVVAKLTQRVPAPVMFLAAAALEIAHVQTGWTVPDEFAARFVYFYTGYLMAPYIFALAARVQAWPWLAIAGLVVWALGNGVLVFAGKAGLPFLSLSLGLIGAAAVICISALIAKSDLFHALRYCGRNSIVIYLAFFLPMAMSRAFLLETGLVTDVGTLSALVTIAGILGALGLHGMVRETSWRFLFERPVAFGLAEKPQGALRPAK